MRVAVPVLHQPQPLVTLEPADEQNVDLLIQWTLDPAAQGPYKAGAGDEYRGSPRLVSSQCRPAILSDSPHRTAVRWDASTIGRGALLGQWGALIGS